jgi:hypothetical protein
MAVQIAPPLNGVTRDGTGMSPQPLVAAAPDRARWNPGTLAPLAPWGPWHLWHPWHPGTPGTLAPWHPWHPWHLVRSLYNRVAFRRRRDGRQSSG